MNTRIRVAPRFVLELTACLAAACAGASQAAAQEMFAPAYPPHATVHGATIQEWTARYWQWAISIPAPENPIITGENCDMGQSGPVWFIPTAPNSGGGDVTRKCTVPAGREILLPIASSVFWSPGDCPEDDLDQCRRLARDNIDEVFEIHAILDALSFEKIEGHREESPLFTFKPPAENIFGLDPSVTYTAVQDGYWVMIPPLAVGLHRAEGQVRYGSPADPRVGTKVLFEITVVPEVYPPHAMVEGKTLEEWSAVWWQWLLAIPKSVNPTVDPNGEHCGEGQSGPVWFLCGSPSPDPIHRECRIPCGKHIFFPPANALFWSPGDCDPSNPDECKRLVKELMDQVTVLKVDVNGVEIEDLQDHREVSPAFSFRVSEDPWLPLDPKIEYTGFSDGYWLMLKPLPPGTYTLHSMAIWGTPEDPIATQDFTYVLTVEPCGFRRGESDGSGAVNLTDAVATLNFLFNGADPLPCLDAADSDDDGKINITDAVFTLRWLFQGGTIPPAPGPEVCGEDPTADDLLGCSAGC